MGKLSLFAKLRRRLSGTSLNIDPRVGADLEPQALVERQRIERGYSKAMPAAPWTDDIARQNKQIADAYQAEVDRRTALFERGEYHPRFGSVENDMVFEMRTSNVTGLQPKMPTLSPPEFKDARTISTLTSEIQQIEASQEDKRVVVPRRPSKREVLDAAGGDEARAAAVEKKLDELFGEDEPTLTSAEGAGPY